jgi:glutamyl-tRNA reductase
MSVSSVIAVSVNHRTVPLTMLERMAIPVSGLPKALHDLHQRDHLSEVVVLSTCNRTEVYVVAETFHGAISDINHFFSGLSGLDVDEFRTHLVTEYDDRAAAHLFGVSSGLRSAVVGEHEIIGQVRTAWDSARTEGTSGPRLDSLFRHALETGKRARTETAISRGTASISQAAVELAGARLGSLAQRSVLVLGAGEIGVSMATSLQHAGVTNILVANRTRTRAAALAARINATTVALHELPTALEGVDVLLTATSATSVVLERDDVAAVMAARNGRPLVIVDTGMPRDVAPDASTIEGVTLLDLDSIRTFVETGLESRRGEFDKVVAIVEEEVNRFAMAEVARQVSPVVSALRGHLEALRSSEVERYAGRLSGLSDEQRDAIDALTRQLMNKIAHDPTVALKAAAGTVKGQRLADSVRTLFDL